MRRKPIIVLSIALTACVMVPIAAGGPIPAHPKDLAYADLNYELPGAGQFREVLPNGMVVYIAEDRMLPTFDMTIRLRTGAAVEPADKTGLASLMGEQMRDGGTKSLTPEELDEKIEFLAASLSSGISDTSGRAALFCLSKDIDEGLGLFVEMLRYPRFDAERLRLARDRKLQNIKRRNDSTGGISRIEWGFLMDGEDHFSNRYPSSKSLKAVTRDDLFAFHKKYIHPGNMIVAVAGDFDRADVLRKIEKAFGDWPAGETGPTTFANPTYVPQPGTYLIHKDEVNQGRVAIGHKSIVRGSPDEFALQIMNGILGGAGFKSRLVKRVRSDEGLAYNTGSRFGQGAYYPGDFQCWFQTKSNACAYATRIVIEEIRRLQEEPIDPVLLQEVISYYTENFPQRFPTKMAILRTYVADEYTGRDSKYWQSYVENVKSVTVRDVQRVARKYLHPDRLVILAVGDVDAIAAGGHDKAPSLRLDSFGKITRMPVRDPDTLKR